MVRTAQLAVLALATGFLAGGARAQTALTKDSPFLPPAGSVQATAAVNENLTLAGMSGRGKDTLVCIYDTQLKRSYWIQVGSIVEGIKVLGFDAARDQATIVVGGQQKLLTLRAATVTSAGANPLAPATNFATPAVQPTVGTPQPPPAPGSIAQQETEARMLVSDLLDIGIQQRKAYEEAQKKAQAEKKKS